VFIKVALCFSGLPRFFDQTHQYWRRSLLQPYEPDVFVHVWNRNREVSQRIHDLYQPKVLCSQAVEAFDTSIYTDRIWPHRTTPATQLSQYTGIKRSLELSRQWETAHNFVYDIVIRARFDWYLESVSLEINEAVNVAHTPGLNGHQFVFQNRVMTGISDQFAYGSSSNMHLLSGLVDNLPHLYLEQGVDFCGELFLKSHLEMHRIPVKQHHWTNGIVRPHGIMP
jgi:hypothetical protein